MQLIFKSLLGGCCLSLNKSLISLNQTYCCTILQYVQISNHYFVCLTLLLSCFSRVQLYATPIDGSHRLCCPWDSPGKNIRVGCHFLLQCMKVKSESEVTQSCLTLSDSMDCSLPVSSVQGIFQARVLEWGAIAFSYYNVKSVVPQYKSLAGLLKN